MRRWFLIALIALLPMRGLLGVAMAAEMGVPHAPAVQAVTQVHDCDHGHDAGEQSDEQAQQGDCPTCAHCQVCSSAAMTPAALSVVAAGGPRSAQPAGAKSRFASAEPAPASKPPIS